MILQALYRYYDILAEDPASGIAPPGLQRETGVSFALNISAQGELLDIFPCLHKFSAARSWGTTPPDGRAGASQASSGVRAQFSVRQQRPMCWASRKKTPTKPDYSPERFEAFRRFNSGPAGKGQISGGPRGAGLFGTHDPQTGRQHPVIAGHLERFWRAATGFSVSDRAVVHEILQSARFGKISKPGSGGQCNAWSPAKRLRLPACTQYQRHSRTPIPRVLHWWGSTRAPMNPTTDQGAGAECPGEPEGAFATPRPSIICF